MVIRPPTLDRPKAKFFGFGQGDRLVVSHDFVSMIADLLPIAPCGRSSLYYLRQASNFWTPCGSVKNQWVFRHSALNLPLNTSMKALSVGLPGRDKSRITPRW